MPQRTFEIGLVLAGAVSAGAYSAGVMDFLIEALDAYYEAKRKADWDGPTHDVRVPVMSGASAGGMTAAICALQTFRRLEHIWPGRPIPRKPFNRLYSSWVTDISIEALLKTTDLEGGREADGLKSILCSDVLDRILGDAFDLTGPLQERSWLGRGIDRSLRLMVTLTNLRGVPYSFALLGSGDGARFGMLNHADYVEFKIGVAPGSDADARVLDVSRTEGGDWALFKQAVLATGAFPVGFAPRLIERPAADYLRDSKVGYEDSNGRFVDIPPDARFARDASYRFVSVDGGAMDNEPLELARRFLSGGAAAHNNANGQFADKAVILIAPFPNYHESSEEELDDTVVQVLPRLVSALIDQARFKPDELAKASNDTIFSRYVVSPSRPAADNDMARKYPIAGGALNGFSGFLDESFRRHDYLLGRRNAQAFLRWNFALPVTNSLFEGVAINGSWHVRDAGAATGSVAADEQLDKKKFATAVGGPKTEFGFPVIPLVGKVRDPIDVSGSDIPHPDSVSRRQLHDRIRARAEKVIATLVDIDFRAETSGILGWVEREGARKFGTEVVAKRASALVDKALDDLATAFR